MINTLIKRITRLLSLGVMILSIGYSALLPVDKTLINMKLVNDYNDIYALAITKDTSNWIQAWLYTVGGTAIDTDFNLVQIANITNSYILPVDLESKQSTTRALIFLSTNVGLTRIVSLSLNNQPISLSTATEVLSLLPSANLVYPPQIIPDSATEDFLVLPFASSVALYKYTPATPSLTFLRTETVPFSNQTVRQVLPFKGFMVVITENNLTPPPVGYAHFIALGVNKEFATINLSSIDGVYLTYDPATQQTLLKTASDPVGIEVQNAPMPYGVIGMQSIQ
ncbi:MULTISPECIES: hypothetical protein [Cysteiniphilum]|uniref:Uncharacterized protein n=1 Tax=Cysteiniphilum litorale TaxID=2056700 RepID=A0A8J2Z3J2_9GAMM|nr:MULTISPECIES: hypothetical protein [Cysteiniphilum]GGF93881.1 hypothetical protein GCM10010995_08900 [Cysteiniphilum litorale]